ncbi:TPA: hypothetical protein ACH3X2_008984 [Trebouxia sp. C0005]
MGVNNLRKLLPAICKRAGADNRIIGHDLQVTFITRAAAAGIDLHEIMTRTGHRQAASLDSYIHDDSDMARAKHRKFQDSMSVRSRTSQPSAQPGISYNSNAAMTAEGLQRPLGYHHGQPAVIGPELSYDTLPHVHVSHPTTLARHVAPASFLAPAPIPLQATSSAPLPSNPLPGGQDLHTALSMFSSGFSSVLQHFRTNAPQ